MMRISLAFLACSLLLAPPAQAVLHIDITQGHVEPMPIALPDLRSRVPVHWGQGAGLSNWTLGQVAGSENVTLTLNNLPAHNHNLAPVGGTALAGMRGTDDVDDSGGDTLGRAAIAAPPGGVRRSS